ncbi:hypothetical protein ACTL6U_06520 [Rhodovibrionaceae bacterium A322]
MNSLPRPVARLLATALFAAFASLPLAAPLLAEEEDELTAIGLPPDTGRDEVEIYCSACHSLRLVVQQGLDRDGWEETITWMIDEQEMEEMEPEDHKLVLDYLAKHVSIDARRAHKKQ